MAPILKIPRQEYSARRRFNEGAAYDETSPKTFSNDTTTSSNVIFLTEAGMTGGCERVGGVWPRKCSL